MRSTVFMNLLVVGVWSCFHGDKCKDRHECRASLHGNSQVSCVGLLRCVWPLNGVSVYVSLFLMPVCLFVITLTVVTDDDDDILSICDNTVCPSVLLSV